MKSKTIIKHYPYVPTNIAVEAYAMQKPMLTKILKETSIAEMQALNKKLLALKKITRIKNKKDSRLFTHVFFKQKGFFKLLKNKLTKKMNKLNRIITLIYNFYTRVMLSIKKENQ